MAEVTLKDISERIDYGLTTSAVVDGEGPKFLRITDIDSSHISWDSVPRCQATPKDIQKYALENGDIVVARTGASTGRSQWVRVEEPTVFASYLVRFRIRSDYHARFIGYVLSSKKWTDYVSSVAHGKSAQPNMSASVMSDFRFDCPPLIEQEAIAEVLGALDDKIAANTKLAQTSLELSRAKFKQLINQTTNKASLKDVLSLEYGKSLPAPKRHEGDVDVFGSGGIVGTHNEALFPGPGVIVGRKGTAGTVHWAPRAYFPIDTTYYVVPRKPSTSLIFCMHLLETLGLNEMNSDSAVPGLNREEALATQVLIPEVSDIQKFTESSTRLFDVIDQSNAESRTLASMRDTLLPRLMSRKLTVKQAEEIVASVV